MVGQVFALSDSFGHALCAGSFFAAFFFACGGKWEQCGGCACIGVALLVLVK